MFLGRIVFDDVVIVGIDFINLFCPRLYVKKQQNGEALFNISFLENCSQNKGHEMPILSYFTFHNVC